MDIIEIKNISPRIPLEVSRVTEALQKAGFEAYLVGGCVRDLIMDRVPKDWDITTNAKPEQISALFEKTVYENDFGTVIVFVNHETTEKVSHEISNSDVIHETYLKIEVTPYRLEEKYTDFRHPDKVIFSNRLEDDLKRRDFTINAIALGHSKGHDFYIRDIFDGIKDIKDKLLRTVGSPDDRFAEDALRMMRAVRFACELGFSVSHETSESILKNSHLIKKISAERVRDEFEKIIMSPSPAVGIALLHGFGLLQHVMPELEEGIGCEQLGEHVYPVWEHLLYALKHAADKGWALEVRLGALFHDIGKPRTRRGTSPDAFAQVIGSTAQNSLKARPQPDHSRKHAGSALPKTLPKDFRASLSKKKYTFYGHDVVGARMTRKIMERMKFPKKETDLVEKFVRNHMFFSDPEKITLSAVRRIIARVGKEHVWELMKVRECDRVGMRKKETPYRLRQYFAMIEEALRDPISVSQLKIDGNILMKELSMSPGPRMGWILHALLEEVLDDPVKNTEEYLKERARALGALPDKELKTLGEKGKEKKEELEEEEISKLHKKHGVE